MSQLKIKIVLKINVFELIIHTSFFEQIEIKITKICTHNYIYSEEFFSIIYTHLSYIKINRINIVQKF